MENIIKNTTKLYGKSKWEIGESIYRIFRFGKEKPYMKDLFDWSGTVFELLFWEYERVLSERREN